MQVHRPLMELYRARGISCDPGYMVAIRHALHEESLSYATPAMSGLVATLFSTEEMIAHSLLQNAIDEAKGGARVGLISNRHASGELAEKMVRHAGDELRHSRQFFNSLKLTSYGATPAEKNTAEGVHEALEFDDDLRLFIARVHSIEIRSWTILRLYIQILQDGTHRFRNALVEVLNTILADEVEHVFYTGVEINKWIHDGSLSLADLAECFSHTNRETWNDMTNMLGYVSRNHEGIWPTNQRKE